MGGRLVCIRFLVGTVHMHLASAFWLFEGLAQGYIDETCTALYYVHLGKCIMGLVRVYVLTDIRAGTLNQRHGRPTASSGVGWSRSFVHPK